MHNRLYRTLTNRFQVHNFVADVDVKLPLKLFLIKAETTSGSEKPIGNHTMNGHITTDRAQLENGVTT